MIIAQMDSYESEPGTWRARVGAVGEAAVKRVLESRAWSVRDMNALRINEPNVDLEASKGSRRVLIQVKSYNDYGWISGGGVTEKICAGGPLFNRSASGRYRCEFVICPTPASPGDKKILRDDWRFFVMPVDVAERLFRINMNAYFNALKADGTPKVKKGACQDWVGPAACRSGVIPDHKHDYVPFENNFDLLMAMFVALRSPESSL